MALEAIPYNKKTDGDLDKTYGYNEILLSRRVDTRQKVKKGQDPKMVPHMKDAIGEMDLEAIDAYVKINGSTSFIPIPKPVPPIVACKSNMRGFSL